MALLVQLATLLTVTYTALALCNGAPAPITPAVEKPPLAQHISFLRLRNVRNISHPDVSELYTRVLEEKQSLVWLLESMERNANSLTGFEFGERLTEDIHMMANFSEPLQWDIDYENNENNAHFTAEMVDIQERYISILEGLSNITGVLLPSGVAMSFAVQSSPVMTLSPNSFSDPDYATDQYAAEEYALEMYDYCNGPSDPSTLQYENIQELSIAFWFLQLDLKHIKEDMSPY